MCPEESFKELLQPFRLQVKAHMGLHFGVSKQMWWVKKENLKDVGGWRSDTKMSILSLDYTDLRRDETDNELMLEYKAITVEQYKR